MYTFLDAWRYDEDLILSASQQEILDVVNLLERRSVKVSLVWLSCGVEKLWGTLEHTCWTDGYKRKHVPFISVKTLILAKTIR